MKLEREQELLPCTTDFIINDHTKYIYFFRLQFMGIK